MFNKKQSVEYLYSVFASTYVLYNKTQNYHWNLKGPEFLSIHKFLEEHYENFQEAIDEIAEIMLMLGASNVNGTLQNILQKSIIKEDTGNTSHKKDIIKSLIQDHSSMINALEEYFSSQDIDPVAQDLILGRIKFHHKALWMLKSETE